MSKKCARCGEFNPRRSLNPSGEWIDYLRKHRDVSPVGNLVVPLCRECYSKSQDLPEKDGGDPLVAEFLTELDTDLLVDEGR
jgi:hypothetical protein